eukprot:GHVS01089090.1.p1 GENE.GHVS01089090.1~~GHVS01089090.1.p1  ORF type:complete len:258 (+),score=62.50 GHVS01089090.1:320-1093(+)
MASICSSGSGSSSSGCGNSSSSGCGNIGSSGGGGADMTSNTAGTAEDVITTAVGLDPFAFKQFDDPQYNGTRIETMGKDDFLQQVNKIIGSETVCLKAGYANFCKHIFLRNFAETKISVIPITPQNKHLLRSGYLARRPEELPVLSRWFQKEDVSEDIRVAKFLDIILYSREQIAKENEAMQQLSHQSTIAGGNPDWSVIAIKAQDEDYELPMAPITMLRNSLISEGGSGVGVCRSAYMHSVEYWKSHCNISDSSDE